MLKDTITNRNLCSEIEQAFADSNYTFRFRREPEAGYIYTQLSVRPDAPEYTPTVYIDFGPHPRGENTVEITVQTTSYGPLSFEDAVRVADGLRDAASRARQVAVHAQLAGFTVTGSAR